MFSCFNVFSFLILVLFLDSSFSGSTVPNPSPYLIFVHRMFLVVDLRVCDVHPVYLLRSIQLSSFFSLFRASSR